MPAPYVIILGQNRCRRAIRHAKRVRPTAPREPALPAFSRASADIHDDAVARLANETVAVACVGVPVQAVADTVVFEVSASALRKESVWVPNSLHSA